MTTQVKRIGFEAALDAVDPQWRTVLTPEQLDMYRRFYRAALIDFSYFLSPLQSAMASMDGGFNFMVKNSNETNHSTPVYVPEAVAPVDVPKTVRTRGKTKPKK